MKQIEELLDPILDIPKLIKRVWYILWIVLIILDIFKLCFHIWYPIIIENENLLKAFSFIDKHIILKNGIMLIFYILSSNIIYLTITKRKRFSNKRRMIAYNILVVGIFVIKYFNSILGAYLEIEIIIIAIIINIKGKKFRKKIFNIIYPIGISLIINVYQLNILFIRNIQEIISEIPTSISIILQIDYYIFLMIMYIGVNMGLFGFGYLWSTETVKLKAIKERELKKEKPNKKKIAEIDKILAERNEEQAKEC